MNAAICLNKGFSSFVNLLVLITFSIILALLLLPSREEAIRAHVSQGLHQADAAKAALVMACRRNTNRIIKNNVDAGYFFVESKYVANIQLSADCASGTMGIRVRTQNTGASHDPEILLISNNADNSPSREEVAPGQSQPRWRCGLAGGDTAHAPEDCRADVSMG
jgi:hypothetical protein